MALWGLYYCAVYIIMGTFRILQFLKQLYNLFLSSSNLFTAEVCLKVLSDQPIPYFPYCMVEML